MNAAAPVPPPAASAPANLSALPKPAEAVRPSAQPSTLSPESEQARQNLTGIWFVIVLCILPLFLTLSFCNRTLIRELETRLSGERDAAREEVQRLKKEVEPLKDQLKYLKAKAVKVETAWKALNAKMTISDSSLKTVKDQLEAARKDADAAQAQLKEREDALNALSTSAAADKDKSQQQLDLLNKNYSKTATKPSSRRSFLSNGMGRTRRQRTTI